GEKLLGMDEFEHRVVARLRVDHRHVRCVENAKRARKFDGQHKTHRVERVMRTEVIRRKFVRPDDGQWMHEIYSSELARALLAGELARPVTRRLESGQKRSPNAMVLELTDGGGGGARRGSDPLPQRHRLLPRSAQNQGSAVAGLHDQLMRDTARQPQQDARIRHRLYQIEHVSGTASRERGNSVELRLGK